MIRAKRLLDPERITKPIQERLDTTAMKFAKPCAPEPQQPKDGRLIQTPYQYRKTKQQMWRDQNRRCAKCGKFLPSAAFGHRHHPDGRGMNGSKRRDDITILLCPKCHADEHPGPQWSRKEVEKLR